MNSHMVINGIPDRLRLDGWWLSTDLVIRPPIGNGHRASAGIRSPKASVAVLALLLVALADFLFWHQPLGVSIALYSVAVSTAMMLARSAASTAKEWLGIMVVALSANLPVIDHLHPLSVFFSVFGVASIAVWLASDRIAGWTHSALVFVNIAIVGPALALMALGARLSTLRFKQTFFKNAVSLLLPVSLGLIFIWLLVVANPFFERAWAAIGNVELLSTDAILRLMFWGVVLAFIWPYLNVRAFSRALPFELPPAKAAALPFENDVINAASVRNSLFLFNGIFAVQTALDLLVLTGGMALPEGMSYASYAHRGAYPLVATAILAGGFAIGTRKLIIRDSLLRKLVYLWLLQNLILVLSALFRLNLYVDSYALTYLRVAAFIWMLLVFVGLALVFRQIYSNKSNLWLLSRNGIALLLVLYASCAVNFPRLIAEFNIAHPVLGQPLDTTYICQLGPQALPAILAAQSKQNKPFCPAHDYPRFQAADGWRDWGFRNWQLQRYLNAENK